MYGDVLGGEPSAVAVGGHDVVDRSSASPSIMPVEHGIAHLGDLRPAQPPARKASTATSLAALSAAGAVPPARPAS